MNGTPRKAGTRSLTPQPTQVPGADGRSPWRRATIGGIGFAVVLFIGLLLMLTGGRKDKESVDAPTPNSMATNQAGGTGPGVKATSVQNGVPVGYPQTQEGAAAAAVNYQTARSSPGYFTNKALRHQVLKTVMTSAALPVQQQTDDQTAQGLMAALGVTAQTAPEMVMRAAPLGTSVSGFSSETATVKVWMTEVVGVPSEKSAMPVAAAWTTYTLILQWQNGDWKIATISHADGPTPLVTGDSAPSATVDMQQANREFDAPRYAG
ncbi:hypothetical protein ACFQ60_03800 [Streptomyces zhihengii]|uniref:DUF8175 domain-containing protein n=1 Tax=Streptomyces zhihengii TaxID=1818004 RepID=A0ABS2V2Z9_9ACTN|nr:hypothetical protein [Streptomyces zhihengii]MBM9623953.1 hypothetical protein [Streptomyces zhihengii]